MASLTDLITKRRLPAPLRKQYGPRNPTPVRTTPIQAALKVVKAQPKQTVVPNRTTPLPVALRVIGAPPSQAKPSKALTKDTRGNVQKFLDLPVNQFFQELPKAGAKVGSEVLRALPRAGLSTLLSATGNEDPVTASTPAQRLLIGDEPVTPIARRTADLELGLQSKGLGKASLPFALGAVVGGTALDLLPPVDAGNRTLTKKLATQLVEKYGDDVAKIIVKTGGRELAEQSLKEGGERVVQQALAGELPVTPKSLGFTARKMDDELSYKPLDPAYESQAGFARIPTKAELKQTSQNFRTQMIDRFAPIKDFVKKSNLKADADPYVAVRNFAGHFGKIQSRLDDLSSILTPGRNILPETKEYAKLERFIEQSKNGITKFEGGKTITEIKARKAEMDALPNALEIRTFADEIRGYTDRNLQELRDGGIISEEAFKAIKTKNQKYTPFDRAEYLADHADDLPRGSKAFSVATQNVIKQAIGSEKEIADPIESLVRQTYKVTNLVERNKVAQKVADLSKLDEFKETVIPLKSGQEVPPAMEKVSVFKNGVKEEYAVPKEVGDALKGLTKESADIITKWASLSSRTLRAGATSLNVAFIPKNVLRDFQTATVVSKVGFTPWDWLKGFGEAIRRGDDYKAFLESGGSFSGFFEQNKNLPKTAKQLTQSKTLKTIKTVVNPVELLRLVGETTELAPRLGVFKRSLRKGLSSAEAAFNARNATVDFAKSGTAMQVANQWVPFLNARLQGTLNTFSAIKSKPISSTLKMSVIVGAPVIATYLNNTKNYPDIWNDIAQYEKDNNFIIIYGDNVDDDGNYTQVAKIPKGDVGRIFGNPLENFLVYLDGQTTKGIDTLAVQFLSDVSPVSLERDGKLSASTAIGGVFPPTIKAGVESVVNTNFFTGRKIVPDYIDGVQSSKLPAEEQYTSRTGTIAKKIGKALGISPAKIENFVGTQFGGLGRQLINPGTAGEQVSRGFSGAKGGQQDQEALKRAQEFEQEQAEEKLRLNREAKRILEAIERSPDPAEEFEGIARSNPALAKAIARAKEKKDKGFTYKDNVIESLQVGNGQRAKFIVSELNFLKTKEEKAAFWDDLVNKRLITEDVAEQIIKLLQ